MISSIELNTAGICCGKGTSSQAAEKLEFAHFGEGHDFSRAASPASSTSPLGAEVHNFSFSANCSLVPPDPL